MTVRELLDLVFQDDFDKKVIIENIKTGENIKPTGVVKGDDIFVIKAQ